MMMNDVNISINQVIYQSTATFNAYNQGPKPETKDSFGSGTEEITKRNASLTQRQVRKRLIDCQRISGNIERSDIGRLKVIMCYEVILIRRTLFKSTRKKTARLVIGSFGDGHGQKTSLMLTVHCWPPTA